MVANLYKWFILQLFICLAYNAGEASTYVRCILSEQTQVGTYRLRVHWNLFWGEYFLTYNFLTLYIYIHFVLNYVLI